MAEQTHSETLWTTQQTADYLGATIHVLGRWRRRGEGPPYIVVSPGSGGIIRYDPAAVRAWVQSRTIEPEQVPA